MEAVKASVVKTRSWNNKITEFQGAIMYSGHGKPFLIIIIIIIIVEPRQLS
jgi:hypothetical protein